MKYLLINPPLHDVQPLIGMSQPTHLLRMGALLKSKGNTVNLFDFEPILVTGSDRVSIPSEGVRTPAVTEIIKSYGKTGTTVALNRYGKSIEEFELFLQAIEKPDKIFVASIMTFHYRGVHETIAFCKKIYPDVEVTVGGIYASLCPEHARGSLADHVFVGEIPEANVMKPDMSLLQHIPEYAVLKTRWGCPNKCSYCAVHQLEGRKIRSLPPELVFRQIRELNEEYDIRYFSIWDSNALVGWNEHLGRLFDLVRSSALNIRIEFPYGFQPDLLTEEICLQMKDADVSDYFFLPIESADEQMYGKRFHRKTTTDDLKKAVDFLREVGYENFFFYVLAGMPDQPLKSVVRSCELAWELGGKPLVLPFTPIPCTEEYENYRHRIEGTDLEDLMPGLLPFCTSEKELYELLQIWDCSMRTAEEAKNI
jgi:hypothetical protein